MSDHHPTAAAVIIGAEVLSGKVDDANGPYLIKRLRELGIELVEIRIIDDVPETITAAVQELAAKADYLFTTGGIGPTHDDLTIDSVAAAFDQPVVSEPSLVAKIVEFFGQEKLAKFERLARIPEGATITHVDGGLLPVIQVANAYVFPGVPKLMQRCFEMVAPNLHGRPFVQRYVLLSVWESEFADRLGQVQSTHADVRIGSYPRIGDVGYRVKLTIDGRDVAQVEAAVDAILDAMEDDWVLGRG